MDKVETTQLALEKSLAAIETAEDELGRLDALAGDGDHGAGMVRGFRAAVDAGKEADSVGRVLVKAGTAFADAAGGASGALVGTLISTVGRSLPDDDAIDAPAMHRALDAGLKMIARLGKAKVGDKTMIDVLDPFINAYGEAAGEGASVTEAWMRALPTAEDGWQSTKDMISKRGRASRLGERSRGHLDPGATSITYVLREIGAVLEASRA
jgi:dihydroxyacetone kinase